MVSANSINRIERAEDGMAALHVSNQLVRTAEPADYVWAQLLGVGEVPPHQVLAEAIVPGGHRRVGREHGRRPHDLPRGVEGEPLLAHQAVGRNPGIGKCNDGQSAAMPFEFTVTAADEGVRLDAFLVTRLGDFSRTQLRKSITAGEVLVDGKSTKPAYRLRVGQRVKVVNEPPAPDRHRIFAHAP